MELISDVLLPAVRLAAVLAFTLLAVAAALRVRRAGTAGRWVGAAFGTIAAAMLLVTVDDLIQVPWPAWVSAVGLLGVILFPYLLLRFTATLDPVPVWIEVVVASSALAGTGLVVAAVVAGDPTHSLTAAVGVLLVCGYWILASAVTATRLWRAGRGQPTVTRRSMRLMGSASAALAAALVVAVPLSELFPFTSLVAHVLALASALAFGAGYAPPRMLRRAWRQPEEEQLLAATVAVLRAATADDVHHALLEPTVRMFNASGAAITDDAGEVQASFGAIPDPTPQAGDATAVLSVPLGSGYGRLDVATGPYGAFFGAEDQTLLTTMGVIAGVALERCELLSLERQRQQVTQRAREQAEQARTEAEQARADAERARAEADRARTEAERANQAKSEFLSRMSHELRTPLNAVLGFGQLLQATPMTDDDAEMVDAIIKAGRHLLDLINDVLDLSRVEAGSMAISAEPVHVGDLVADTMQLVRPMATDRRIDLTTDAERCQQYVHTDRQRARQILLNLLSNAIKYNRDAGQVAITCTVGPKTVRVAVADTGPGIDPAHHDQLFEPFQRLGAEGSAVEGTGLGLALSRNLAQRLGGDLGVASTPGNGSTFWIDLPLADPPAEASDAVDEGDVAQVVRRTDGDGSVGGVTARLTLLLVEDNLANLRVVEAVLRRRRPDVQVLPVMQGSLAVDLAVEHQPDMVLLDLHLPDLPGQQVLQRLKADPRTRHIPVVIASADATPGRQQRLRDLGAHDYLAKPYNIARFLTVIEDAVNQNTISGGEEGNTPGMPRAPYAPGRQRRQPILTHLLHPPKPSTSGTPARLP
jgi:signal transduction histidine kinase/ActR/RegA family two-component response regulator